GGRGRGEVQEDGHHDGQGADPRRDRVSELDRVVIGRSKEFLGESGPRLAYLCETGSPGGCDAEVLDGEVPDRLAHNLILIIEEGVMAPAAADADPPDRRPGRIGELGHPLLIPLDQGQDRLARRRAHREHPRITDHPGEGLQPRAGFDLGGDGKQTPSGVEYLVAGLAGQQSSRLPDPQFPEVKRVFHADRLYSASANHEPDTGISCYGSSAGWSTAHSQLPSGWRRAISTVAPPPATPVEGSARSPLGRGGRWPAEVRTGRLARKSR